MGSTGGKGDSTHTYHPLRRQGLQGWDRLQAFCMTSARLFVTSKTVVSFLRNSSFLEPRQHSKASYQRKGTVASNSNTDLTRCLPIVSLPIAASTQKEAVTYQITILASPLPFTLRQEGKQRRTVACENERRNSIQPEEQITRSTSTKHPSSIEFV